LKLLCSLGVTTDIELVRYGADLETSSASIDTKQWVEELRRREKEKVKEAAKSF